MLEQWQLQQGGGTISDRLATRVSDLSITDRRPLTLRVRAAGAFSSVSCGNVASRRALLLAKMDTVRFRGRCTPAGGTASGPASFHDERCAQDAERIAAVAAGVIASKRTLERVKACVEGAGIRSEVVELGPDEYVVPLPPPGDAEPVPAHVACHGFLG